MSAQQTEHYSILALNSHFPFQKLREQKKQKRLTTTMRSTTDEGTVLVRLRWAPPVRHSVVTVLALLMVPDDVQCRHHDHHPHRSIDGPKFLPKGSSQSGANGSVGDEKSTFPNLTGGISTSWRDDVRATIQIHRLLHHGSEYPHQGSTSTSTSSTSLPFSRKTSSSPLISTSSSQSGDVTIDATYEDFGDFDCNSNRLSMQLQLFCHYYSNN